MSISSAEVAADFKDALQDLRVNSRPEISNLTIIAKENTEHAEAISRELENHIRTTQPECKLPALYVLDSIVKNVGTPYTVYLGRNLYRTFMDAFMVMDPANRRAMEGLLKTWKQPVPESMDSRPVFSHDVTRDIENALIKIRTVTVQQQAFAQRPQHGLPPRPGTNPPVNGAWRNTPTPPQNTNRFAAPNDPRVRQSYPQTSQHGQFPVVGTPPTQGYNQPISSNDLENLKADLAKLIASTKTAWELSPSDMSIAQKLKALLDLQTVLNTQTIPPQQLQQIRTQVQALSPPPPPPVAAYAPPVSITPQPFIQQQQQPLVPPFPPPTGTPLNLAQLLANVRPPVPLTPTPTNATQSLADMLRRVSSPMQPSSTPTAMSSFYPPPQMSTTPQPILTPNPAPIPVPTPTTNLAQLLAQVSKPVAATTPQGPPSQSNPISQILPHQLPSAPTTVTPDWLLNSLKGLPLLATGGAVSQSTPMGSAPMTRQTSGNTSALNNVQLTTQSMKQPRFHLISKLYGSKPNICTTCGRRFESTPQGKEKKARHMDWHFKVKDPDAAKRGVHRSWYISEREWIEYHEVDETSPEQPSNGPKGAGQLKKEVKDKYVRVPTDATLAHAPCPICQEKFDPNMKWHVEANDFVWMDAINVNGKIYHATCWDEYSKGAGIATPSTPDSVLGKRKAEVGSPASGKKIRAF